MAGKFTNWLKVKLKELNIDVDVFGSYITGILEDDDSREDKQEALVGILEEILDASSTQSLIDEIFDQWQEVHPANGGSEKPQRVLDVDEQLARLLDQQKIAVTETRQYTDEERKIKEQILAQYSQCSDEDDFVPEGEEAGAAGIGGGGGGGGEPLMRNTNALDVANLAKEKREQQKIDSANKKLKDKEDREKQKQLREEKKEKRKTVKGERRR